MPSRNEPFGIVILEAWSAGKPVVTTNIGGPNEFVRHEYNGLMISPQPDSIAWGLETLFSDFDRARWMGVNGRQAVDERFAWSVIAGQIQDVYGFPPFKATDSQGTPESRVLDAPASLERIA